MPRNDDGDSYDDPAVHQVKMVIFGVIAIICLIVFLIIIFGSIYTIDAGDRGIILTFGKASTEVIQPGFHLKMPIAQSVVVYSVRTQTIKFDNPANAASATPSEYDALSGASKDLQNVQVAVIVNYNINEKDVLNIYQQYGDSQLYQTNILEPIIRNAVKATTAHYDAVDLIDNRSEVVAEATAMITKDFADKSAVLDNLNIVNFLYSSQFTQAIENKVTQQQNALAEQNKLAAVQFQAQQRIATAEGEAKAIQIQVAAINSQGGANYIQLQAISRWNGQLPYVSGTGSIPFIDMRTFATVAGASQNSNIIQSSALSNTTG